MNIKQTSTLFTVLLMAMSTFPIALAQGVIQDQGVQSAILVTDITAEDTDELIVQYLGDTNARLHWSFYDETCTEEQNLKEDVTPLEIVDITIPPTQQSDDLKVLIWVEDTNGDNIINQPLAGIHYTNDRVTVRNIPAVIADPEITIGGVIAPADDREINFDGLEFEHLAQNIDYLPFLVDIDNFTNNFTNRLFFNTFNSTPNDITSTNFDDDENEASHPFQNAVCVSLFDTETEGLGFSGIGGGGIVQGLPPSGTTVVGGAGVIRTAQDSGVLFGSAALTDRNPDDENKSLAQANYFMRDEGDDAGLGFINLSSVPQSEPQGLFTNFNDNYQNPYAASAVSSIGIQKPILEDSGTSLNESGFNRETIFAVYNRGAAREINVRFDFLEQGGSTNACQHQDLSVNMTANDVEYFRVSQFTGESKVSPDLPVVGVLTAWDPSNGETLLGYHWDVIIQAAAECSDGIDNDGDGFVDSDLDTDCTSAEDDDEGTAGTQKREDDIFSVDTMGTMLTLDATTDSEGVASFEAAKQFTTIVPTIEDGPLAEDYNIMIVNWDALDDDNEASQEINFQVTDMEENTKSLDLAGSCITVLNRQSFGNLADGSAFGTDPDFISITGEFNEPNKGLAAFLYFNKNGIDSAIPSLPLTTEGFSSRISTAGLAFTSTHHDGEIFTDINSQPGSLPGESGTFIVDVGVTTSVALTSEDVTATWYAAQQSGNTKTKGPVICSQTESITASAGDAFGIVVDDCLVDPLSIDAILRVESTNLGTAEIFVPEGP